MTLLQKLENLGFDSDMAKKLIKSGKVLVNEEVNMFCNTKINKEKIRVKKIKKYVSRGALKLLEALNKWNLDFKDKVILDIGSSTGGFTQVSLEKGAKFVYALDVGTNQLDYSLRINPKVISLEKTNLKLIKKEMFKNIINFVVTDVSFISLKNVFKVLEQFDNINIVALIKPQFEANSDQIKKNGFVEKSLHPDIIKKVKEYAFNFGFNFIDILESPIKGKKSGNIEYLSLFERKKDE